MYLIGEYLNPKAHYVKISRFLPKIETIRKHSLAARRLFIRLVLVVTVGGQHFFVLRSRTIFRKKTKTFILPHRVPACKECVEWVRVMNGSKGVNFFICNKSYVLCYQLEETKKLIGILKVIRVEELMSAIVWNLPRKSRDQKLKISLWQVYCSYGLENFGIFCEDY